MTKLLGPVFYRSELWIVLLCTVCLQLPDLKIAGLQLAEIIMLALFPFFLKKNLKSKTTIYFILYYVAFFLKTLIFNYFTDFYINDQELTFIKHPGFISLARLIEMFACVTFCGFIASVFSNAKDPYNLLKTVLFVQMFIMGTIFISVYLLYAARLLSTTDYENLIVYDASQGDGIYRLKGFFVEGGPFGLFYAFLFTICIAFYKKLNLTPWYLVISLLLIILAQSKAGYMLVLLNAGVFLITKVNALFKNLGAKIVLSILIIAALTAGTISVFKIYINSLSEIEQRAAFFGPGEIDPNFMMGRISATVIVPNMLKSNVVKGIGWGNYPLTRNNPAYRDFMPEIPVSMWDATGFGGITDMLIEAGLVFFLIYIILYIRISKLIRQNLQQPNYLILALVGPLLLGVSIYFFYTWFLLGVLLFSFQYNNADSYQLVTSANKLSEDDFPAL
ncbi:hypothetical protein ABIB62_001190 [Mucilaginibacter sp. UYP25]|uniref:hypothetical protein n=1 Tax=unclassified Mucilaginibacter TaxID=2617802 RepID=UPI003396C077